MVGAVVLLAFAALEQISFRTLLDGQLGSVHPFLGGCHPHHLQLLIGREEVVSSNYQVQRYDMEILQLQPNMEARVILDHLVSTLVFLHPILLSE